jgi:hypothetical protein
MVVLKLYSAPIATEACCDGEVLANAEGRRGGVVESGEVWKCASAAGEDRQVGGV